MSTSSVFGAQAAASTGLHFIRAYNIWHTRIKKCLAQCRLTHPQFVFLSCAAYLAQTHEHVTQSMISAYSDIDMVTVSQLAVLLEKKKMITRTAHPVDTRAKSIALTEHAREALHSSVLRVEEIDREFFAQLGKEEAVFLRMLKQLAGSSPEQAR